MGHSTSLSPLQLSFSPLPPQPLAAGLPFLSDLLCLLWFFYQVLVNAFGGRVLNSILDIQFITVMQPSWLVVAGLDNEEAGCVVA